MKTPAIVLTSIVLASCAPVGPNYEGAPEVEHGKRFSNASRSQSAPSLDRWWKVLGDSGLNRLVERVLRENLDLRIAQERLREARSLRKQAASAFRPQATGNLAVSRIDFGGGGDAVTGGITGAGILSDPLDYWSAGVDVSWEVDVFGGRRRQARAATARAEAAQEALHAVRLAIVSETVETYYTVAGLQEQLAQVNKQIRGQESQLADQKNRRAAGGASELDVDRARARLDTTRAQAPPLRAGIETQQRRLLVLQGSTGRAPRANPTGLPRKLPMIRSSLPAALITRRPDIRQAERELAAATEDIGVATANFYPRFSLLGSPNVVGSGNLFDAVGYYWQLGPSVSWSLLSGGRNQAILEAADARQKQAFSRYEKAVVRAINEVEAELVNLRSETQRLALVQRARQATARSVKRARETHQAGALDYVNVLIEEERLRTAEIAEVRVKSQLILIWTRFHKALGGGWK